MIYDFALNFDSINKDQADCKRRLESGREITKARKGTPGILLVNRLITREALFYLYRKPIVFSHGLYRDRLTDTVCPHILRKVTSIMIDDAGSEHDCMVTLVEPYTLLAGELARALKGSRALQELTLSFRSKVLLRHLKQCWASSSCYYFKALLRFLTRIGNIRGLKKVTFEGAVSRWSNLFRFIMESAFFRLPRSVRQRIYGYALDWNDINRKAVSPLSNTSERQMVHSGSSLRLSQSFKITTPTILLLNRQIAKEALATLHKKPLVLNYHHADFEYYCGLISPPTLQTVRSVVLKLSVQEFSTWRELDAYLGPIWQQQNNLNEVHFKIDWRGADSHLRKEDVTQLLMGGFERFRSMAQVTFED